MLIANVSWQVEGVGRGLLTSSCWCINCGPTWSRLCCSNSGFYHFVHVIVSEDHLGASDSVDGVSYVLASTSGQNNIIPDRFPNNF